MKTLFETSFGAWIQGEAVLDSEDISKKGQKELEIYEALLMLTLNPSHVDKGTVVSYWLKSLVANEKVVNLSILHNFTSIIWLKQINH